MAVIYLRTPYIIFAGAVVGGAAMAPYIRRAGVAIVVTGGTVRPYTRGPGVIAAAGGPGISIGGDGGG